MTICPYCDYQNIEGADVCDKCDQPLSDQHLYVPATAVERGLLTDRLHVLHPKPPVTVSPSASVREVLQTLCEQRIGCVVVVENEKLVGIFSERDALLKINDRVKELGDRPISEFMTASPQSLAGSAKIAFAVHRMDLGSYRHVPVVDEDGAPEGVISVRDILRYLTQKMTASC